jgi:hypothetical protein
MPTKNCELCGESTAREPIVHESCHDRSENEAVREAETVCRECEGPTLLLDIDNVVHDLRMAYLPHYRAMHGVTDGYASVRQLQVRQALNAQR